MNSKDVRTFLLNYNTRKKELDDGHDGYNVMILISSVAIIAAVISCFANSIIGGTISGVIAFILVICSTISKPLPKSDFDQKYAQENLSEIMKTYSIISSVEFSQNITDIELLTRISNYTKLKTAEDCSKFLMDEKNFLILLINKDKIISYLNEYQKKEISKLSDEVYNLPKDFVVKIEKDNAR